MKNSEKFLESKKIQDIKINYKTKEGHPSFCYLSDLLEEYKQYIPLDLDKKIHCVQRIVLDPNKAEKEEDNFVIYFNGEKRVATNENIEADIDFSNLEKNHFEGTKGILSSTVKCFNHE